MDLLKQVNRPSHPAANLRLNRANPGLPCFSIAHRQRPQIDEILSRFNKRLVQPVQEAEGAVGPEALPQADSSMVSRLPQDRTY